MTHYLKGILFIALLFCVLIVLANHGNEIVRGFEARVDTIIDKIPQPKFYPL